VQVRVVSGGAASGDRWHQTADPEGRVEISVVEQTNERLTEQSVKPPDADENPSVGPYGHCVRVLARRKIDSPYATAIAEPAIERTVGVETDDQAVHRTGRIIGITGAGHQDQLAIGGKRERLLGHPSVRIQWNHDLARMVGAKAPIETA